jgi:hypothetical protein
MSLPIIRGAFIHSICYMEIVMRRINTRGFKIGISLTMRIGTCTFSNVVVHPDFSWFATILISLLILSTINEEKLNISILQFK